MREEEKPWWVVPAFVVFLCFVLLAWQLSPLMSEERGLKQILPTPAATPESSRCTTEWDKIDWSFLGQRVCVRGNLHNAGSFESFFGTGAHVLYLRRSIASIGVHEGDCVMADGIVGSESAHPLYIQADSVGLCPRDLPAWWPWGP